MKILKVVEQNFQKDLYEIIKKNKGIISGSLILNILTGSDFQCNDIDIYFSSENYEQVKTDFLDN